MRVVHLGNVPVPVGHPEHGRVKQHPGRWVLNLALAQKASGFDVEIVSLAHKATRDFNCEIEGVQVHYLRTFHPYRHLTLFLVDRIRMARFARNLRPDLVVGHGTEDAYGWAALGTGLPFCLLPQGLYFQIIPALGGRPTIHQRFFRLGENRVWKRTRFAVAVSRYVGEALARKYPHLEIAQIPLTYEPALDQPVEANRGLTLAYIGSMDERKGIIYLVDTIRQVLPEFPMLELHVCGNPNEATASGYPAVQLRALRDLLGSRLVLHGIVSSQEVFSVLRHSTALVAPSLNEMFGCQCVEALMCGAHAIVTEDTAMAENVRIAGNGTIVPQRDAGAIAEAIRSVFRSPPSQTDMEGSRQRLRDYLGPVRVAELHRALYAKILKEAVSK